MNPYFYSGCPLSEVLIYMLSVKLDLAREMWAIYYTIYLLSKLVFTGHSNSITSGWSVQLKVRRDSSLCPTGSHCISDGKQDTGSQEQWRLSYCLIIVHK